MIRLRVDGLMLEKLLSLALKEGAEFRTVRREGRRCLILETDARGAKILLKLAQRFSIPCEILEKRGLNAAAQWLKRRWTLFLGILLGAVLLALFASRVWFIDVEWKSERPVTHAESEILDMLAELGVHPGMSRQEVQTDLLAMELEAASEDFSFAGVRLQGVRLLVEVAPAVEAPEVFDLDSARDLVATADGIVLSVNALSGKACVEPGDVVRRGDVLIRGEERISSETTREVAALGEVLARTWVVTEATGSTSSLERRYTSRESTSSKLELLGWEWPLWEGEHFSLQESTVEELPVGGLFLPLRILRTTEREYVDTRVPVDEEALKTALAGRAEAMADAEIAALGEDVRQIVDKWIDYSMIEEDRLRARCVIEVQRNIAGTRASAGGG